MKFSAVAALSLLTLADFALAGSLEDRSFRFYRNRNKYGQNVKVAPKTVTKTVGAVSTSVTTTTVFVTVGEGEDVPPQTVTVTVGDDEEEVEENTQVAPTQTTNVVATLPPQTVTVTYTTAAAVTTTENGKPHVITQIVTLTTTEVVQQTQTVDETRTIDFTNTATETVTETDAEETDLPEETDTETDTAEETETDTEATETETDTADPTETAEESATTTSFDIKTIETDTATATETESEDAGVIETGTDTAPPPENTGNPGGDGGDPQTSLTLDTRVIQPNLAENGQPDGGANDGQVPSLTSVNNFINFCLTQPVALTDGKQIREGSCNPVPMGRIIAKDLIPTAKFVNPINFSTIPANTAFEVQLKVRNFQTGSFVNAATNYYGAPAQVNDQGIVIGHSHVVIERLNDGIGQTEPADPTVFAFFKGLNEAADGNGILRAQVTGGLAPGAYRMFSINTASNHQPVLASVAQHGSMDDGVYFTCA